VVGSVFLFSTVFSNLNDMAEIPSIQVVVPGSSNITLSQPEKYTIFYEYHSVVGNRIYSTGEEIPGLQVNLISTDTRDDIPLSSASVNRTYTVGGRSGIGLLDFTIDQAGIYELSASYPPVQGQQEGGGEQNQEIVLAVIHSSAIDKLFGTIMGAVASVMAIVFIPFVVGIVIIVITFIKRRKTRTRTSPTT
jgi:hypothetical protein